MSGRGGYGRGGDRGGDRGGRGGAFGGRGRGGGEDAPRGGGGAPHGRGGRQVEALTNVPTVDVDSIPKQQHAFVLPHLFGGNRSRISLEGEPPAKGSAEALFEARRAKVKAARAKVIETISAVAAMTAGNEGEPSKTTTNFVPVEVTLSSSIYQYDVKIAPEVRNRRLKNIVVRSLLAAKAATLKIAPPCHSNNTVYSARALHAANEKSLDLTSAAQPNAPGWRGKTYIVTLTPSGEIPYPGKGAVSTDFYTVLNCILAEAFDTCGFIRIGGKFYDIDGKFLPTQNLELTSDVYGSLQLVSGINLVLHPTQRGLLLNVDLSFRTTRKSTVLDHMKAIQQYQRDPKLQPALVRSELEGAVCISTYAGEQRRQTFKITSVCFDMTPNTPMPDHPAKLTFKQYMQQQYNLTCRDDAQPMLKSVATKELDKEGQPRVFYFIPEFSKLAGQSLRMRNDSRLQQDLKRICIIQPKTRFERISSAIQQVTAFPALSQYLKQWGIKIHPNLIVVGGRTMQKARLLTAGGRDLSQNEMNHSWLIKRGMKVSKEGTRPDVWCVVHPEHLNPGPFVRSLLDDTINGLGANWPEPMPFAYASRPGKERDNIASMLNAMSKLPENAKFALFVLPDDNAALYHAVKRTTLQEWKIPSQCVLFRNAQDGPKLLNVTSRVGGQMLVKMGNSLWSAQGDCVKDTLICGLAFADSVVAVSACDGRDYSMLGNFSEAFTGKPGSVIEHVIAKALHAYRLANGNKPPTNLIVFRPGMNEGDVPVIVDEEVIPLQVVCNKQKVKLCFMTALKRSHARFYPAPPGFVVDRDVLPGTGFSFLLIPQVCNIGTATAMKFSVLCCDIPQLNGANLERTTYNLCHMFYGWWGTTREPSVVMYATRQCELHSKLDKKAPLGNETLGVQAL